MNQRQAIVWRTLVQSFVVALLARPSRWLLLPFAPRLVRGLYATARAESQLTADAVGDEGASVGVLQFHVTTWERLGMPARLTIEGADADARVSPEQQGEAAARYLVDALRTSPARWWRLLVGTTAVSLPAWRSLWLRGPARDIPYSDPDWVVRYVSPRTIAYRSWEAPPVQYRYAWGATVLGLVSPLAFGVLSGFFARWSR